MAEWCWDGEIERWRLTQSWQRWYPKSGWIGDRIVLSVAGSPDCGYLSGESRLRACASRYATQVAKLEKLSADYLVSRPVRVYDTAWEGPKQPSDIFSRETSSVVHAARPIPELVEIEIPDLMNPNRVHVWVETYYPDPYYRYCLIFEERVIVDAFGEVS